MIVKDGVILREIGGYIELDTYMLPMLHDNGISLNCGRNALAYILLAKNIKRLLIPYFLCDSVYQVCLKYNVEVDYYHICDTFFPQNVNIKDGEWIYIVNYYGQLSEDNIKMMQKQYNRIIIDNAQAYFMKPVDGIDTIYTCRKFFGVPDGAFLYTNKNCEMQIPVDESYERMRFLLGRYEKNATEFYPEYVLNNELFLDAPIKQMSRLTRNLLHGIDYDLVCNRRTENFRYLHEKLGSINKLKLHVPDGAFMYPFCVDNGMIIRKKMHEKKIYIPVLWPSVLELCQKEELEYNMVEDILPLPIDQRYDLDDMEYLYLNLMNCIKYQ